MNDNGRIQLKIRKSSIIRRKRGYPMIEPKEKKWPPTEVGGHFLVRQNKPFVVKHVGAIHDRPYRALIKSTVNPVLWSRTAAPALGGETKEGRKNPPQHIYHIITRLSSQRQNGPGTSKSVFRTKSDVCIWETFRLEKLKKSCYLIVTKRRYLNSKSSGGLPKANGKNGNQTDFKSK